MHLEIEIIRKPSASHPHWSDRQPYYERDLVKVYVREEDAIPDLLRIASNGKNCVLVDREQDDRILLAAGKDGEEERVGVWRVVREKATRDDLPYREYADFSKPVRVRALKS